jgi:hypothetical protein
MTDATVVERIATVIVQRGVVSRAWAEYIARALLASGVVLGTDLTGGQLGDIYNAAHATNPEYLATHGGGVMEGMREVLREVAQRQASEGAGT